MKLLRHEYILGAITLLFIILISFLSFRDTTDGTLALPASESASEYLININTADAEELDLLQGIGPKLAERIVAYRNEHGDFKSVSDLCDVSGIGTSLLEEISHYIEI